MFINRYRLWHDNTGKRPGWFLSRILVRDLNKQSKYYFICDQWLAADKGDGQVIVFFISWAIISELRKKMPRVKRMQYYGIISERNFDY